MPDTFSTVLPRHVLCFLGPPGGLAGLRRAAERAIAAFASGFSIDDDYALDEPDDRMPASFDVSRDRVHPQAWTAADATAVAAHGAVLYVLGPPMQAGDAVTVSATALRLVAHMLEHGATAAKGESAGIAHGRDRWLELAAEAAAVGEPVAQARTVRLAFARRPLSSGGMLLSVGFHLVGLPEVHVVADADVFADIAAMDHLADTMQAEGVAAAVATIGGRIVPPDGYAEDDFRYNPYGAVEVAFGRA